MMSIAPDIVNVQPHKDYTVSVYFSDGTTVLYDMRPKLSRGIFKVLKDPLVFMERCKIMNNTLAWDINGNNDPKACIDIDHETIYSQTDS